MYYLQTLTLPTGSLCITYRHLGHGNGILSSPLSGFENLMRLFFISACGNAQNNFSLDFLRYSSMHFELLPCRFLEGYSALGLRTDITKSGFYPEILKDP